MSDVITEVGNAHIPDEIKKAPDRPPGKEYTRQEVIQSFDTAFGLFQSDINQLRANNHDVPQEALWMQNAIQSAIDKTDLAAGRDTFTVNFENHHNGQQFSQQEGIPVEGLINFLHKKASQLKDQDPNDPKIQEYVDLAVTLWKNSKSYIEIPGRMNPNRHLNRVQYQYDHDLEGRIHHEAYLISQDSRAKGSMDEDWFEAERELINRRELQLPPEQQTATPEPVPQPEPAPEPEPEPISDPEPAPEPEPEPEPEPIPPVPVPPTPEEVKRELILINRTKDIEKRARDMAERQLREEMQKGSLWNPLNWARKIGLRVGEEYYRQVYIERARQAMLANNNSYLEMNVVNDAVTNANANIAAERAAGQAKVEQVRLQETAGEDLYGHNTNEASSAFSTALNNEILRPIIQDLQNGVAVDEARIQQSLRKFMKDHENDTDADIRNDIAQYFGRSENQSAYGRVAEYFATDMLDMAQQVVDDLNAQKYTLEQIDQFVKIKLAYASWGAETTGDFNNLSDRFIRWSESVNRNGWLGGWVLNPAALGAAASLITFGGTRLLGATGTLANAAVPGVGLLAGAGFAAMRRNYDLKVDRTAHQVERAYNRQIQPDSPRREALEDFAYDTATANELLNGGGTDVSLGINRDSMANLLTGPFNPQTEQALYARIAEIKSRLDFSTAQRSDLIVFDNETNVEQNRLELVKAVIQARQRLLAEGIPDHQIDQAVQNFRNNLDAQFIQNKEQQDRRFQMYRLRNAAGSALFAAVAGITTGALVQEGVALGGRALGFNIGPTAIESGINATLGTNSGESGPGNGVSEIGNRIREIVGAKRDADSIFQEGNFTINIHSGDAGQDRVMSMDLTNGPRVHGITKPDGTFVFDRSIPGNENLSDQEWNTMMSNLQKEGWGTQFVDTKAPVSGPEGEWAKHSTNVDHREWYSYDRPGSQGNELGMHTIKDGQAITLDINNMTQAYQKGLNPSPIDVQQVIQEHKAGWYFSTPNSPQDGIWVSDGADGVWDGKLRLDPTDTNPAHVINTANGPMQLGEFSKMVLNESAIQGLPDGDIATEVHGRQEVFSLGQNGKYGYIEAGQMRDGNVLQSFATIRGEAPLPDEIGKQVLTVTPPTLTKGTDGTTIPLIPFPFAPRHPLEPLGNPEKPSDQRSPEPDQRPDNPTTPVPVPVPVIPPSTPEGQQATVPIEQQPLTPEQQRNLQWMREERDRIRQNPNLATDRNLQQRYNELQNAIDDIEGSLVFPEGEHTLDNYFRRVQGEVNPNHQYFIENPQAAAQSLTQEEINSILRQIPDQRPFFVPISEGVYGPNSEITPIYDFARDERFQNAEAATNGDSGLLALAAASASTPEQQAALYYTLTSLILNMHLSNPRLLEDWLRNQASNELYRAQNGQPISSLGQFILYDGDQNGTLRPEQERLLSYSENGNFDPNEFNNLWQQRLQELAQRIQSNNLQPHHLRWIEFLSHSANLRLLMQLLKDSGTARNSGTQNNPTPETLDQQNPNENTTEALHQDIATLNQRLTEAAHRGALEISEDFVTANKYLWQAVTLGKESTKHSDDLYRGYLMINPQDMAKAVELLVNIGRQRAREGKGIDFKWLKMTFPQMRPDQRAQYITNTDNLGKYPNLELVNPRIALYGDNPQDIQEILAELAKTPEWQEIENHRIQEAGGRPENAPRRPGTNAYIDSTGKEWRSLNFNNQPGYSEDEAADPDWRSSKIGLRTQPIP